RRGGRRGAPRPPGGRARRRRRPARAAAVSPSSHRRPGLTLPGALRSADDAIVAELMTLADRSPEYSLRAIGSLASPRNEGVVARRRRAHRLACVARAPCR